ncbi:MAG: FAD-binding oxidoreductase [Dehalococcoidia bacterium]|nr:FAD-binding oxidoreductase [Dehalococcoidia bacterium]
MTAPSATDPLRAALPPDRERRAEGYAIDGVRPAAAFRPASREEVAALLAAATGAGLVVVPQGGRSALTLGRPLQHYDVALDLGGLDRVVHYEPNDLTLTVEAGLTLERLQPRLAERGQYLSVDPPPHDGVTVGGLLATARPGAWRGHLPDARDLVLGVHVAQADGTLARSGGRVVKNVSGYDLHRLHTGALGAYGVIVEASFKLAPLPEATSAAAVRCTQIAQAEAIALDLWRQALAARAITLLGEAAAAAAGLPRAAHVLCEFAGVRAAVERSVEALRSAAANAHAPAAGAVDAEPWRRLRALAAERADGGTEEEMVLRLGVPATALRQSMEAAEQRGYAAWGHVAAGSVLVHGTASAAAAGELRALAAGYGGFLQVEAGPAWLRASVDPFGLGERELVRSLKAQFDPTGTINRGRWMEDV